MVGLFQGGYQFPSAFKHKKKARRFRLIFSACAWSAIDRPYVGYCAIPNAIMEIVQ